MLEILASEANLSPDELGGFAEVFERYGFGTVCCVVIVLGIFWFVKQNTKTQDRLWEKLDEMSKNNRELSNPKSEIMSKEELKDFIVDIVRDETSKLIAAEAAKNNESVDVLSNYTKIAKAILPMLKRAKDDFGADRISAFVFHNGTHSSHGLPFYKYTCIQEIINRERNIPPRISEQQAVPLTILDEMTITSLAEEQGFIIDDVDAMGYVFPMATARLKRDSFASAVGVSVCTDSGETVGFVFMAFVDRKTKDELRDIMIRVHERASSFSTIMDFNNNRDIIMRDL